MANPNQNDSSKIQGEGDYESARRYQKDQHDFAKDEARVQEGARKAEDALDGPEGAELERAREDTAKGRH